MNQGYTLEFIAIAVFLFASMSDLALMYSGTKWFAALAVIPVLRPTSIPWEAVRWNKVARNRQNRHHYQCSRLGFVRGEPVSLKRPISCRLTGRFRTGGWSESRDYVWIVVRTRGLGARAAAIKVRFFASADALRIQAYHTIPFSSIWILLLSAALLFEEVLVIPILVMVWFVHRVTATQSACIAREFTAEIADSVTTLE